MAETEQAHCRCDPARSRWPRGVHLGTGDGALKGFGVRMMPSGAASYLVQYRTTEAAPASTLGEVGVLTPDQARGLAADKLKGGKGRRSLRRSPSAPSRAFTIVELTDLYLAEGPAEKPNKKASSWATDRSKSSATSSRCSAASSPCLSATHVAIPADVAAGKSQADIKTKRRGRAIVDGGRGTAARSLAVLGAMLQFALRSQADPSQPGQRRQAVQGRQARAVPVRSGTRDAWRTPWRRWKRRIASARPHRGDPAAAAERLPQVGNPVAALGVGRFRARHCLRLPDRKTGAKAVPLAAAASKVIAELPRRGDYRAAGGQGRGALHRVAKGWGRVRDRAALAGCANPRPATQLARLPWPRATVCT